MEEQNQSNQQTPNNAKSGLADFSWSYNPAETFSHQALVMTAYRKVIDALACEMRKGYFDIKTDQSGNRTRVYHPDSRLAAIECVITLKNLVIADCPKAQKEIAELEKKANDDRERYLKQQLDWWNTFSEIEKHEIQKNPKYEWTTRINVLHSPFLDEYLNHKVVVYRRIFETMEKEIASTSNYFKKEKVNKKEGQGN